MHVSDAEKGAEMGWRFLCRLFCAEDINVIARGRGYCCQEIV